MDLSQLQRTDLNLLVCLLVLLEELQCHRHR